MKRLLIAAVGLWLMSGCVDRRFVYKPGGAVQGATKVPVKLAVLPLADGTENFTRRGGLVSNAVHKYNLAKSSGGNLIDPLPPEFWSRALADEMTASGRFEAVRFFYDRSEMTEEDFYVEGRLEKAYLDFGSSGDPHEFEMILWATRRVDTLKVWEGTVRKASNTPPEIAKRCQTVRCLVELYHNVVNRAMQELFAEAAADLAAKIESRYGEGGFLPAAASPRPAAESVDETIEGILRRN